MEMCSGSYSLLYRILSTACIFYGSFSFGGKRSKEDKHKNNSTLVFTLYYPVFSWRGLAGRSMGNETGRKLLTPYANILVFLVFMERNLYGTLDRKHMVCKELYSAGKRESGDDSLKDG